MDEYTTNMLRSIFQHKINIHPMWGNQEQKDALKAFFDMDEEEIEALHKLANFIADHGLERIRG